MTTITLKPKIGWRDTYRSFYDLRYKFELYILVENCPFDVLPIQLNESMKVPDVIAAITTLEINYF